ncbi:MAG: DUF484 family protein [Oceanospirillaceae bacterium]|nr:DUF484 family protein [Oceanospirillaceae bacterium]
MSTIDSNTQAAHSVKLDEQSVARYLRENPTFISQHPDLLAHIELAHECGQATSLIERQTLMMRQKITHNAARMSDILSTARRNDVQFEKTKRLVIELAAAADLNGLTEALKQSFTQEFSASAVHLALFSPVKNTDDHINLSSVHSADENEHYNQIQALSSKKWAYCQAFESVTMAALFPGYKKLKSSAIVPLYLADKAIGVLIIASDSKDHYNDQLDTLFLNHVASVTSACLGRIRL